MGRKQRLGTDPNNPDTDGDTINDGDEVMNNTDPLDACDPNLTPECNPDPIDLEITKSVNAQIVSNRTGSDFYCYRKQSLG